jgi:hypothetical protein
MSGKNTLAEGVTPRVGFPPTQSGVPGAPGVPIPINPINIAGRAIPENNNYTASVEAREAALRGAKKNNNAQNAYNATLRNLRGINPNVISNARPEWTEGPKIPTNMNRNLSRRSQLLRGKEFKPNPHVMLDPTYEKPFYSNMWLNDAHTQPARIFGKVPENILNRYKYERGFGKQLATRSAYNSRQRQHFLSGINAKIRKADEERAIIKADKYLTAKLQQQALEEQQRKITRNLAAARNLKRTLKSNYRAADAVLKPKKWYEFWKGGRSRKNRKSRNSRKSRKSRRNSSCGTKPNA